MPIVTNMLRDVLDIANPPQKGEASFFRIFPREKINTGDTWSDSLKTESVRSTTNYRITAINDTAILVDVTENSVTTTKADLMGTPTVTTLNNKSTGKIIVNKATGIIREKIMTTESSGSTAVKGGSLPVTSKIVSTVTVKPIQ
jgi:uncharacterized protein with beta-barrel porin domain